MAFDLNEFLIQNVFAFLFLLSRIGTILMLLPGIGDGFVPARVRLLIACAMCLLLMPVLQSSLPAAPAALPTLLNLITGEILVGLFVGGIARLLLSAVHVAGMVIATQSSLSSAMLFDATQGSQGTTLGNFLTYAFVTVLLAADVHHMLLQAAAASYTIFAPGVFPMIPDMTHAFVKLLDQCFAIGLRLSMPVIIASIVLYFASGILARLMPAMQVFFIIMPAQIMGAFAILALSFSTMAIIYTEAFKKGFMLFLGG